MAKYLFLAFIVVPLLDLYLLVLGGREIGAAPVLWYVVMMALLGASLAKREGLRVMRRWQTTVAQRQVPEEGLLSGVLVLAGGLLLVIPGVLTDVMGLFLIIPPTRRWVAARLRRALERRMRDGTVQVTTSSWGRVQETHSSSEPFERPEPSNRRIAGEVDAEFTEEGPGR